jgi:hypothetical protein
MRKPPKSVPLKLLIGVGKGVGEGEERGSEIRFCLRTFRVN